MENPISGPSIRDSVIEILSNEKFSKVVNYINFDFALNPKTKIFPDFYNKLSLEISNNLEENGTKVAFLNHEKREMARVTSIDDESGHWEVLVHDEKDKGKGYAYVLCNILEESYGKRIFETAVKPDLALFHIKYGFIPVGYYDYNLKLNVNGEKAVLYIKEGILEFLNDVDANKYLEKVDEKLFFRGKKVLFKRVDMENNQEVMELKKWRSFIEKNRQNK